MRATVALAAALAVTLAPAADAAPKKKKKPAPPPVCNLVKDPSGDSTNNFNGAPVWPADSGLDIVSADVATGTKQISAVIRLASDAGKSDLYLKRYIVQFNVAGFKYPMIMAVAVGPSDTSYSIGWNEVDATGRSSYKYSTATATGTVDSKTLTVTAALAAVAGEANLGVIKKGTKINGFVVTANRRVPADAGLPGMVSPADEATSSASYVTGTRSCVKAL